MSPRQLVLNLAVGTVVVLGFRHSRDPHRTALPFGSTDLSSVQAELARLSLRGIRTARVVQERAEGQQTQLKLPALTQEMKRRLNDLKPALAGRTLKNCS